MTISTMFEMVKKDILNINLKLSKNKIKNTTSELEKKSPTTTMLTYYRKVTPKNILYDVLKKNGFEHDNKKYNLYIPCGYTNVKSELKKIHLPECKYIFGFIECDKIIRKNNLWDILEKTYGRSNAKQIMPESFIIENTEQYKNALQKIKSGTILICKKNIQRKLGLTLTFTTSDLIKAKMENYKVAQYFLKDTMKIKGRKLNMRIYYVIRKYKEKIQFFVNTNGKVLYTKKKTNNNTVTFETHITSQMDVSLYENENMPHDFNELKDFIGKEEYEDIWSKIIDNIKYLSKAIAPIFNETKYYNKVCFQLFGMDVIIENNNPYILEINKGPDMNAKCEKDYILKKDIYESTFQVVGLLKNRVKPSNYVKVYETQIPYL